MRCLPALLVLLAASLPGFGAAAQPAPRPLPECREVLRFALGRTSLLADQEALLARRARDAQAGARPLFIVFSTTDADGAAAQEGRVRSIERFLEGLHLPGLRMQETGTADVYFSSEIYVDSCADEPDYGKPG